MKAYIIESGHFSEAGNFIGYTTLGERVHIYRKQIFEEFPMVEVFNRHIGKYDKGWMKFPFYCLAQNQTFTNTNGEFIRLTAEMISTSKFKIKLSLIDGEECWFKRNDNTSRSIEWQFNNLDKRYTKLKEECEKLQTIVDNCEEQKFLLRQQHEQEMMLCDYAYDQLKENYAKLKEDKDEIADQLLELHRTHQYTKAKCDRLQRLCTLHKQTISTIKDLIK
jgi:hypothetical protein